MRIGDLENRIQKARQEMERMQAKMEREQGLFVEKMDKLSVNREKAAF